MLKILIIIGTRPEAIKMAPVIAELARHTDLVKCRVCVTGQHREMLAHVLDVFDIHPDCSLDIMKSGQSLSDVTVNVLRGLEPVYQMEKPDIVMVQGDTTTTFAASLSAQYHKVRVGHVEAGLRTGNKSNPFPEEINRCLVGAVSDWHFAPTEDARNNLLREGVSSSQICVTGNTSIDAIQMVTDRPFTFSDPVLSRMNGRIVLITAHRRESFGEPLQSICHAIRKLAGLFPHDSFVYPVHLNPEVHGSVYSLLGDLSNVILTDPLKYLPFAHLMKRSHLILTDSGGIQEEAPALNKPVLVMRDMTERMEAIEAGAARLVGTESDTIVEETVYLLTHPKAYEEMAYAPNPYGDGNAAEQIASFLFSHLFKPARA